ncbi:GxxExxY protein [Planctomyces sp. SCGC AG-212-M04]|nr:GxxExxY protein [Planctomyces sp. SCGC AG-212-M04]
MIEPIPDKTETVVTAVIDAAFHVHTALGPGLLESVYEACLCHELSRRGLSFERQLQLPIVYVGLRLESGLRLDLVVAGCVIVELKHVETVLPVHKAQLLTYLKLTGHRVGILLNFDVERIKEGIHRVVR